jgi:hypothetical protein
MPRSRPLIAVLLATVLVSGYTSNGTTASAASTPLAARPAAGYHRIPPAFAGFNAPFWLNSGQATSPQLHQAAASLRPGALRVFGGITANYWNWRSGRFYDKKGVPANLRAASHDMTPIHLSAWAQLVDAANAEPVFDLNVVTSNLSDQLAMLRAAQGLGMPVQRIELGNEIYLDTPVFVRRFPTPQAYGRTATRWIHAIKRRFPAAQVAATGRTSQDAHTSHRQARWTRRVLKTLHGEAAVTFHTYWRNRPRGPRLTGKRLWAVFSAPLRRLGLLHKSAFRQLPRGVDAWLTEWTPRPSASMRGTWAHGLSNAEYLLGLLGEPRVRQEDLHALILKEPGGALFSNSGGFGGTPGTVPFGRTAVGAAVGELHPLLSGGAGVRELEVRHAPHIPGTRLAAIRAAAVKGRGALLLNLTSHHRLVRLVGGPACGATLDSVWARPAARITGRAAQINHQTVPVQGPLSLPAYSVNRMEC